MGVSRALRRAAAKKAFKENIKMSDLDKEFTEVANSEAIKKMTVDIVTMMILSKSQKRKPVSRPPCG